MFALQVRRAYLTSVGTSGVLTASALLALALVSAIVAFHAWPGVNGVGPVPAVPVEAGTTASEAPTADRAEPARTAVRAAPTARDAVREAPPAAGVTLEPRSVEDVPSGGLGIAPGAPQVSSPVAESPAAGSPPPPTRSGAEGHAPPPAGGVGAILDQVPEPSGLVSAPGPALGLDVDLPSARKR